MRSTAWRREIAHGLDQEVSVPDGGLIEKSKRETWNLICLEPPADMTEALAIALWPDLAPGRFRSDFWYVERLRLKTIGNSEHVTAEVELSLKGKSDISDPNPLRRPLSWEMDTDYIEIPAEVDADGKRIVNKAGDPIRGIVGYEPILVWTATRYITTTPEWLKDFAQKCTNSETVSLDGFECEPETLKMEGLRLGPIDYAYVDEKTIRFREMPLRLMYKKTKWIDRYLNQGFNRLIPAQNKIFATNIYQFPARLEPIVDSTGKPIEKEVPLAEDGNWIFDIERVTELVDGTPTPMDKQVQRKILKPTDLNYIEVQLHKKLDFNLLFT